MIQTDTPSRLGNARNPNNQRPAPNRVRMTQLWLKNLRPPKAGRMTYWDTDLPGFGLRVSPARRGDTHLRGTWLVAFRPKGTTAKKWETIDPITNIPDPAEARKRARDVLMDKRDGKSAPTLSSKVNSVNYFPTPLPANQSLGDITQGSVQASLDENPAGPSNTFAARLPEYLLYCETKRRRKKKGPNKWRTIYEKDKLLNKHVMPHWRDRDINAITRAEAEMLIDGMSHLSGSQYRIYSILGHFFTWAEQATYVAKHPMAGMGSPYDYKPRKRYLSDDEIRWFWWACEELGWPHGIWAKMLLLTGQRCSEVSNMVWSEIDEHHVWRIPEERTKADREHVVSLSDLAIDTMRQAPKLKGTDRLFPGPGNTRTVKKRIDDLMLRYKREELAAVGRLDHDMVNIRPWVFHDLRRTAATVMVKLGNGRDVAHKILNHSDGEKHGVGMLDQVYVIYEDLPARARALQDLSDYVLRAITETPIR